MIGLIQRVTHANVKVNDHVISEIQQGILLLLGVEKNDTAKQADRLVERVLGYRIFEDQQGKMNLSLRDIAGQLLVVPQFTLVADTHKGMRPSFTPAAAPSDGEALYQYFIKTAKSQYHEVMTGQFGANMQVSLCNDGPVTIILNAS